MRNKNHLFKYLSVVLILLFIQINVPITTPAYGALTRSIMVPEVSITVFPHTIDFGSLAPGESSENKSIFLNNTANSTVSVTAQIGGESASLYRDGLNIDGTLWDKFQETLNKDEMHQALIQLQVPINYSTIGANTGTLIFWAEAVNETIPAYGDAPDRFATRVVNWTIPGSEYYGSFRDPSLILGGPRGAGGDSGSLHVVSIGLEKSITLAFDVAICDGSGDDFIVSENGFFISGDPYNVFGELAFVEVSTDGITFARFPCESLNEEPMGPFGGVNWTKVHNLAGSYPVFANADTNSVDPFEPIVAGGNAFDLSDLSSHPLVISGGVDLQNINFVRIVDILGDGNTMDSYGNPIYDPTGGMNCADFDSVAVINYKLKPDWDEFQGDPENTGHSYSSTPTTNKTKWASQDIGAIPSSSPVVHDNVVYVGAKNDTDRWFLYALNKFTGEVLWNTTALGKDSLDSWSSPAYANNMIYIGATTKLYAINATTGVIEWEQELGDTVCNSSPKVLDNKVIIGNWGGKQYNAFNATTGSPLWNFTVNGTWSYAQGTASYFGGKEVFLTSWAWGAPSSLYSVWVENGTLRWQFDTDRKHSLCGSPTIAGNIVYVASYNFDTTGRSGYIYAINIRNGTLRWKMAIQETDATPTVAYGMVFVSGGYDEHEVIAFNATSGDELWNKTDVGYWTNSVVVANNTVYAGVPGNGYFDYKGLYALNATNGETIWTSNVGGATCAISEGVIYTISQGRVYAIGV